MTATAFHDNAAPGNPAGEPLPELDIQEREKQSRLTVLLRLLLLIPQFIVLFVLGIVAFFAVIAGWFSALVLGRLPEPIERYLTNYLGYGTRVDASSMLVTDRYPPFSFGGTTDYPVQIELVPHVRLNRLAVLFRIILMIPAGIVSYVVGAGWWAVGFIIWLVVLIMGRVPRPLFQATAAVVRYRMRMGAYTMMLTSSYPKRLFGDQPAVAAGAAPRSATRPLLLETGGKVLLVIFIVLGVLAAVANGVTSGTADYKQKSPYSVSTLG